jgi:hypothetical protein
MKGLSLPQDWYRVTHWDAVASNEFERRLARSRSWNRAQYLRIQGITLWEAGRSDVAKDLLQRVLQEHPDDLEAAAATEHLAQIAAEEGNKEQAEAHLRSLLSTWPDLNGTTGTAEVLLADLLSQQQSKAAHQEALDLLEHFLDREHGIRWSAVMFQWHLVRIRLAELSGEHEVAARHAADALELADTGPQLTHHHEVGLVQTDEVTVQRLRRLAGPFPTGTGAPYGWAPSPELQARQEEKALLDDLAAVGVHAPDVYALDVKADGYARALPVLFRHLQQEHYSPVYRSDIARAMGTPLAAPMWNDMVNYYHQLTPSSLVRDGLASALSDAATKDQIPDVVAILNDARWGENRIYFLRTLTRLRHPDRWALIADLTDDPDLGEQATHMLKQFHARQTTRRS